MSRDEDRVAHIIDAAHRIAEITSRGRAAFDVDHVLQAALVYNIQVIGEAAARLSDEFRSMLEDIPWRQVIGMRNLVVHDYFDVDLDLVWQTAVRSVPDLAKKLES